MRRRQILLGAGATLLLRPFLKFRNSYAQEVVTPPVFILAHKPQGMYPNNTPSKFLPAMSGGQLVLSPVLSSLSGFESTITAVAGVNIRNFQGWDWHHSARAIYTGSTIVGDKSNASHSSPTGESIDQRIAREWGVQVKVTDFGRNGYPAHNTDRVSFKKTPDGVQGQDNAAGLPATFKSLIGDAVLNSGMNTDEYELRARRGQSLLDRHLADVRTLQGELPSDIAARLEAHVDGFRDFERATFEGAPPTTCDSSGVIPEWQEDAEGDDQDWVFKRAKLNAEMIAFAAACGLHRVFVYGHITDNGNFYPTTWEADKKPVAFRGTDEGSQMVEHPTGIPATLPYNNDHENDRSYHIGFWHSNNKVEYHAQVEDIVFRYSYGYLVKQLAARGALESTLMLYGSQMSFDHSNENHSFLFIGGASGKHRGGRVLSFGEEFGGPSVLSNSQVLASTLQLLGINQESFGEAQYGTGSVPGLV
jgi:hypothetical protein